MTGLKRGTVAIIPHQAEWEFIAQETIVQLKTLFGPAAVDIQHIGSTAIRSIQAKPIIDIAVGVRSFDDLTNVLPALESDGYLKQHNRFSSDLLYVLQTPDNVRTHQVHILLHDSEQWHNYVDFRDFMNAHPDRAREYEALKQRLVIECRNVQTAYTDGKREFMQTALAEAKSWAAAQKSHPQPADLH